MTRDNERIHRIQTPAGSMWVRSLQIPWFCIDFPYHPLFEAALEDKEEEDEA